MKLAVTLALLAGTFLPNFALARDCHGQQQVDDTGASCMPGLIWDSEKDTCVGDPTS